MANVKCKVNWLSERSDENDDNNGLHHGIYVFDCDEDDFDVEAGYGSYDILEPFWYETEKERDIEFNKI